MAEEQARRSEVEEGGDAASSPRHVRPTREEEVQRARRKRLSQLRARLVAVSLRSRSLRLTRASRTGALDLHRLEAIDPDAFRRVLEMLGADKPPVAICDVEPNTTFRAMRLFVEDVAALAHAAETAWSETGARDLAVGFPFLEGRTKDGTWIRAPLLLYPVKLTMTTTGRLSWVLEALGPPELNESLAHALVRLASVRLTVDGMLAHDDDGHFRCDPPTWAGFVRYLKSVGFESLEDPPPGSLPPFEDLPARDKSEREGAPIGAFTLRPQVVLGRFPRSDSSIVADYDDLLAKTELNDDQLGLATRLLEVDEALSQNVDGAAAAPPSLPEGSSSPIEWRVFPSDDSQDEALTHAGQGAIVVQGPPGTGKSQMIANLLASAIAEGKRVLVVCQKRAALDVVADRLSSVGLREPVAIVYDVQRDRGEVCEGIARTLNELGGQSGSAEEAKREIEERTREHARAVGRLQARLEAAERAFKTLSGGGAKRPGLATLLERSLDDDGRSLPVLGTLAQYATEDEVHALLPSIELLARDTQKLALPHPIADRADFAGRSTEDLRKTFTRIVELASILEKLHAVPKGLLPPQEASKRAPLWEDTAVILDPIERNDRDQLRAFLLGWVWTGGQTAHGEWQNVMETLRRARKKLEEAPPELVLEKRSQLDAWILDLNRLEPLEKLWYRFFLPGWWSLRKRPGEILSRCKGINSLTSTGEINASAVRTLCQRAIPWQELIDKLPVDNALFDFGLRGELSDLNDAINVLETHHARTRAVHKLAKELASLGGAYGSMPALEEEAPETLGDQAFLKSAVDDRKRGRLFDAAVKAATALEGDLASDVLAAVIDLAARGETEKAHARILAIAEKEADAEEAARLDHRAKDLPPWARKFLRGWRPSAAGTSAGDDLLLALERAWILIDRDGRTAEQIEAALVDADLLAQLSKELDACLEAAGRGVLARYRQRVFETLSDRARGVSLRKLAAEVGKKRNRATMRQLVERHWDQGLSSVRPIWFCSPEAVASLFPLKGELFDLVVLDEASQCPVEAALPMLTRTRRALIAGDDQQMPPTHFFRANTDDEQPDDSADDSEEEELSVLATHSILALARIAFPSTVLRWHYRSRHEELVAFSNAAFYGRKLITAPRAGERERFEGLAWVRVNGLWQGQTNEIEAEHVVELVAQLLSSSDTPPSIGIIAFNKKQADLIQSLLDRRMTHDDAFRQARERDRQNRSVVDQLFVRNLENVQGDERDVIIISLAYGPTERGGRVHARFGPLGLEGGEKRLNVAITRARRGLMVVTSIEPRDLDTSGSKHVGPKLLKSYLELVEAAASKKAPEEIERILTIAAEQGGGKGVAGVGRSRGGMIGGGDGGRNRAGSRVCLELAAALENRNLRTQIGVGLGHRRLDLAVGREGETERWRLGIDCSEFLTLPDAMSRDVYMPRFWNRLGWRVMRVSPGMWIEDRANVIDRIVRLVSSEEEFEDQRRRIPATARSGGPLRTTGSA